MPRGGYRKGKPGVAYGNRTDLNAQPIRTAPGQEYGKATQQAAAQRAMPLAQTASAEAAPAAPANPPAPVPLGGLYQPTMRSDEPVQAGLAAGVDGPTTRDILLAIHRRFPNDDLMRTIERMR